MDLPTQVEDTSDAVPVHGDYYATGSASNIPPSQQSAPLPISWTLNDEQILSYRMNHVRRGKLIVICNSKYDASLKLPERKGFEKDLEALKNAFCDELNFEGKFLENLTSFQMFEALADESMADHSDCDCLAVVIMTHGKELGQLYGTDRTITVEKLVEPLKSCETLFGKPKLIFIQACRGANRDRGVKISSDAASDVNREPAITIPVEADFLYAYSTAEGYFAFKNALSGSWFIQALCAELQLNWNRLEIMQMLTRVCHKIAYECSSYVPSIPEIHNLKQVSSVITTLTKALYFRH